MKYLIVPTVLIVTIALWTTILMCGCNKQTKTIVHIPSQWGTAEYVKEIKHVWFIDNKDVDVLDVEQRKRVVEAIWKADLDGKTVTEIQEAFKTRQLNDVLDNGV